MKREAFDIWKIIMKNVNDGSYRVNSVPLSTAEEHF